MQEPGGNPVEGDARCHACFGGRHPREPPALVMGILEDRE